MKTQETLTIIAITALGLCLLCGLAKMAVKNDKAKKGCDQACSLLVFIAVILVSISQLLTEDFWPTDCCTSDGCDKTCFLGKCATTEDCDSQCYGTVCDLTTSSGDPSSPHCCSSKIPNPDPHPCPPCQCNNPTFWPFSGCKPDCGAKCPGEKTCCCIIGVGACAPEK